ncbi:MAG: T9SS type A sorting domain-containing protein [Bacteroidota bacterium]
MIKKLLLSTALVFGTSLMASAQCIPDPTITIPGIYPDSATGLSSGIVGTPYTQVIQAKVPVDTVVSLNGLPPTNINIANITVTGVTGLPPGLTYSTTPANGIFPGGSNGCMFVSGTPTTAGVYFVNVILTTNATFLGFPVNQVDTLDYYSITINTSSGIGSAVAYDFGWVGMSPNPANNFTDLDFTAPSAGNYQLGIFNILGKEMASRPVRAVAGLNRQRLDLSNISSGVYLVSIRNGNSVLTRRLVVSKK